MNCMAQQAFFHLCLRSSLATETYHTGVTIQWFCRLDLLTQTHKYTSTDSSLSLGHSSLGFYTGHSMCCCSLPSWGDEQWLPDQINSAGSSSKNNVLTQIPARLFSCHWAHGQAQPHCLPCPFWICACQDRTWALEQHSLQMSYFSPFSLTSAAQIPDVKSWAFPQWYPEKQRRYHQGTTQLFHSPREPVEPELYGSFPLHVGEQGQLAKEEDFLMSIY